MLSTNLIPLLKYLFVLLKFHQIQCVSDCHLSFSLSLFPGELPKLLNKNEEESKILYLQSLDLVISRTMIRQ